jgi:hypothetical protein
MEVSAERMLVLIGARPKGKDHQLPDRCAKECADLARTPHLYQAAGLEIAPDLGIVV